MRGKTLKTDFPFGRYKEAEAAALRLGKVKSGQAGPNPSTAMPSFLDPIRALANPLQHQRPVNQPNHGKHLSLIHI